MSTQYTCCCTVVSCCLCLQIETWAIPPAQIDEVAAVEDMAWQALVAELVLLVTALSAQSDGAAAVDSVLPSVLLTGANTAAALDKRFVASQSVNLVRRQCYRGYAHCCTIGLISLSHV